MNKIIYNKVGIWALLLTDKVGLLALLLIVVVGFTSCSKEEVPDLLEENGKNLIFNINVGDYHAFSSSQTRAIGTPDPGKNSWEVGDKVLVEVALKYHRNTATLHTEYLTYSYNGSSWNCIFGNEKIPTQKGDASSTKYNFATFKGYYNPAYSWIFNYESNRYELQNSGAYTEAVNEAFIGQTGEIIIDRESIGFTISFQEQMTTRLYSRLRVVAAPNVGVSLNGEGLRSSWTVARDRIQTLDSSYKARTVTDSNGNAFFYISWGDPNPLIFETYDVITGTQIKQKTFTPLMGSVAGKSYQVDMR